MTNKKLIPMFALSLIAIAGISMSVLYEAGEIGITDFRNIGVQYTPWDTDRMVKHSDAIVRGTVISTEPTEQVVTRYHDEANEILETKTLPYQLVTIQVDEVIKGENIGKTIILMDKFDSIVTEYDGKRIKVTYDNSLTYDGGETGIFFADERDGVLFMDGFYSFLVDNGNETFSSGFHTGKSGSNLSMSDVRESKLKD